MIKKGLELYLIISSLVAVIIVIVCSVVTVSSNIVIKQSLHQGVLFDLIELKSQGMIELDDLFDDIFD
ncbi:hypothetical protein GMB34_02540 [Turicibacter sanguinis]|nr:hypothetical protein [Turicibacter sanguinis]MTN83007.1 hypothetical protein [Turicibacter sanguinis]MTN85587.1 hypothetical protein [Turicibacter sanguinis]MTN88734.1 hypothetical protein [Turicibacter sanguinis]MTN91335.1 hypothetical protein [Turicibacter sanguinis]